jgi:hypothetical protein
MKQVSKQLYVSFRRNIVWGLKYFIYKAQNIFPRKFLGYVAFRVNKL